MPATELERFGWCSETERMPHELLSRLVGVDERNGEATVICCARCGRCWLHYLMEYEYLTAAGRWLEGEISPEIGLSLKPSDALPMFESMEWFHCSGSAFGGELRRVTGPVATWLTPFPGQ